MVTRFGRFCRNLRMDNEELLCTMAGRLGVSPAFLSRVENGKAKPPVKWGNIIISEYHLDEDKAEELKKSISNARENVIKIDSLSPDERDMIIAFAKQLHGLDKTEKDKWKKILKI